MKKYFLFLISLMILGCNRTNKNVSEPEISKEYAERMVVMFKEHMEFVDNQWDVTATFEELSKKGLSRELYDNYMRNIEETNAGLRQDMEDGNTIFGPSN